MLVLGAALGSPLGMCGCWVLLTNGSAAAATGGGAVVVSVVCALCVAGGATAGTDMWLGLVWVGTRERWISGLERPPDPDRHWWVATEIHLLWK